MDKEQKSFNSVPDIITDYVPRLPQLLLTSWQELHDEVEVGRVLEAVVHLDDPLVVGLHQDVPLSPPVGHLGAHT